MSSLKLYNYVSNLMHIIYKNFKFASQVLLFYFFLVKLQINQNFVDFEIQTMKTVPRDEQSRWTS